jgi:hypothetical protein
MNPMTDAELQALVASIATSQQARVEQQQRTDQPLAKTDTQLDRVSRKLDRQHQHGGLATLAEAPGGFLITQPDEQPVVGRGRG